MIKSILGGKSKNLCDVAYLLTLPVDKKFEGSGYWRVLINAEPNTTYTFSRENANRITGLGIDYLVISAYDDISHNQWLNHPDNPGACNKSATLTTGSDGKLWILFNETVYNNYWQKNLNPFGYIQLELGSTATEYVPHELTSYKSIMKVSDVCQLIDKSKFTASGTTNGITWVSNGDGSITLNGTCTSGFALNPFNQSISVDQTHFYYSSPYVSINYGGGVDGTHETGHIGFVKTPAFPTKFNTVFYIWIDEGKSFSNVTTFINIDDLTEMFGAGNEPKTVAEFKAKFPNDYYSYSPSCFVTSFDERMPCKTKNLFDKSNAQIINGYISGSNVFSRSSEDKTIIIPCLPNTTYTFSKISVSPFVYDRLRIGDYTAIPVYGNTINNVVNIGEPPTQNYITITTSDTAKYIVITVGRFHPTVTTTLDYILSTCQLELDTIATDYVPYGYV